jgi:hypothetical protein
MTPPRPVLAGAPPPYPGIRPLFLRSAMVLGRSADANNVLHVLRRQPGSDSARPWATDATFNIATVTIYTPSGKPFVKSILHLLQ